MAARTVVALQRQLEREIKHRSWLAQNLQHDLRLDAYRHVQHLELAYFERNRTGNLMSVLNDDVNQLERFVNGGINDLLQVFFGSLMVGGVFFVLTREIAFLALIPVPFILYGAFWFQSRLAPRYAAVRAAAGAMRHMHDRQCQTRELPTSAATAVVVAVDRATGPVKARGFTGSQAVV